MMQSTNVKRPSTTATPFQSFHDDDCLDVGAMWRHRASKARTKSEARQKDTVLRQKASFSEAFWRTPLIICYLYALATLR